MDESEIIREAMRLLGKRTSECKKISSRLNAMKPRKNGRKNRSKLELKRLIGHMNIRRDEQLLVSLDDREKEVVYGRFVNGKTLQEMADKFGLTRERIRQIQDGALRKMSRAAQSAGNSIRGIASQPLTRRCDSRLR